MSVRREPQTDGQGMLPVGGRRSPAPQGMPFSQLTGRGSPGARSDTELLQDSGHLTKHQWPPDDPLSSRVSSDKTGAGIELQPLAPSCLGTAQDTMQTHHTYPSQDNPTHPPPSYNHSTHQAQLSNVQPQSSLTASQQGMLPNIRIVGEDNTSLRGSPLHQARYPTVREPGYTGARDTGSTGRDYRATTGLPPAWADLEDSLAIRNGYGNHLPSQQGSSFTQQHLTGQDLSQGTSDNFNSPASSGIGKETASTGGPTHLSHYHPLSEHAQQTCADSPGVGQGESVIPPSSRSSNTVSPSPYLLQGEGREVRPLLSSPTGSHQLGNGKAGDNVADSFQGVSTQTQPGNSTNGAHSQEKLRKKGAGWARLRHNKTGDNSARERESSPGPQQGTERASSRNTIHPEGNQSTGNGHSNQATTLCISAGRGKSCPANH